jgi:serine/threonine-protein kinase PpkA
MPNTPCIRSSLRAAVLALTAAAMVLPAAAQTAPRSASAPQAQAAMRKPLLVEGKRSLFQRVLTRPGARLLAQPAAGAAVRQGDVKPFSVFYVYGRQGDFLEVGASLAGGPVGFLPADRAIDWKQTIVAAFNNPAGRERSLLFRDQEAIDGVIRDPAAAERLAALRAEAAAGRVGGTGPVLSIEPETHINIDDNFYILPIMEHADRRLPGRLNGKILRVAAVRRNEAPARAPQANPMRDFKIGLNFVIDTTITMGPYIARTQEAVERIQAEIARSDIADRVRFGLTGFRQSLAIAPRVGYHTRIALPLDASSTSQAFLARIKGMDVAQFPTPGWREDSLGGVFDAIKSARWEQFGGRFVVLVTDAGPRLAREGHTRTRLDPRELNGLAQEQNIAVFTLHLRTPQGAEDNAAAEGHYRQLSAFGGGASLYFGVDGGRVDEFGRTVDELTAALLQQMRGAVGGAAAAPAAGQPQTPLQQAVQLVGLAMQLSYLGDRQGAAAPDVFEAWVSDRDIANPRKAALDVRVFLTKQQLANLRDVTQAIIEKGEASIQSIDPASFFQQLRTAVAAMSRDPSRLMSAEFGDLGDALGEFLQDLPYQSDVMRITEQRWLQMSGAEQREMIDRLKSKLGLYEQIHNTPGKWTALADGVPDGERVSAVPLAFMP